MIRAIECFNDAVMFIDVAAPGWKIMHMNEAAHTRLKLHDIACTTEEGSESCLWDVFRASGSASGSLDVWQGHEEDIRQGRKFEIASVLSQHKSHASAPQPLFTLTFR